MEREKERRCLAVRIDWKCYSGRKGRIGKRMKPEEPNQDETALVADVQPLNIERSFGQQATALEYY
jgi:hypothetical protein